MKRNCGFFEGYRGVGRNFSEFFKQQLVFDLLEGSNVGLETRLSEEIIFRI